MPNTLGEVHTLQGNKSVFYPSHTCYYWSNYNDTFVKIEQGDSVVFDTDKGLIVVPDVYEVVDWTLVHGNG